MSKKTIIYILIGAVLYLGIALLYQRFQGSVTLSSNSRTTVFYVYDSGKKSVIGKGNVKIRGPGHNTVYAEDGDGLTVVSFVVERWKTKTISAAVNQPASPEVFTGELAQDIIVSGNTVRFLHPETHQVLQAGFGDRANLVAGFLGARSIYWINYKTAVYEDIFGKYYVFAGNKSTPLNLPNTGVNNPIVTSIAVGGGGEIVLIADNNLYYYPSVSSNPKHLDENVQADAALDVNGTEVVYAEKVDAGDDTLVGDDTLPYSKPVLIIYSAESGQKIVKDDLPKSSVGAISLVTGVDLSPENNRILLTTVNGIYVYQLYEQAYLSIELEPSQFPLSAQWINSSEAMYTTDLGVWIADLNNQTAWLIARGEGIKVSSSLRIHNNYVWFGDNSIGRFGTGSIKRIQLPN